MHCHHEFCLKSKQSVTAPLDARLDSQTLWKVAAICRHCRIHCELDVDCRRSGEDPCPNRDHPLHHLRHMSSEQPRRQGAISRNPADWRESHTFECSSPTCPLNATIRLKFPLLTSGMVRLLVDPDLLRQRQDAVFASEGERLQGVPRAQAIDVLNDLRIYIKNSWTKRSIINLNNKRFMTRFGLNGAPCKNLLEFLGFTSQVGVKTEVAIRTPLTIRSQITGLLLSRRKNTKTAHTMKCRACS